MPELTVTVRDGSSEAILGKVRLTFTSQPREQEVLQRLSHFFNVQPLGGELSRYVERDTAPQNADALKKLFIGQNAEITILVERRPSASPTSFPTRSQSDVYQRIVEVVRTAINDTSDTQIGPFDTDPNRFSSAIASLSDKVRDYSRILEDIKLALSSVEPSLANDQKLPEAIRNLVRDLRNIQDELEHSKKDRENFKSSLEQLRQRYTLVEKEKKQLEEQLRRFSEYQTGRSDDFEPSSVFRDEPGAI